MARFTAGSSTPRSDVKTIWPESGDPPSSKVDWTSDSGVREEEKQLEEFGESDRKSSLEQLAADDELLLGLRDKEVSFAGAGMTTSSFDVDIEYGLDGLFEETKAKKSAGASLLDGFSRGGQARWNYQLGYRRLPEL